MSSGTIVSNWSQLLSALPDFTADGLLPAGDYALTLAELRESLLVHGPNTPDYVHWDAEWRSYLVDNLETLVRQLWKVDITGIYVDGSFVEDKYHPNDIDGYFECSLADVATGELQRRLNALDPHKIWTWNAQERSGYRGYPKEQLPMWHRYRVELWPHYGQSSGMRDEYGHELEFPAAFRKSRRERKQHGVIKLVGDTL